MGSANCRSNCGSQNQVRQVSDSESEDMTLAAKSARECLQQAAPPETGRRRRSTKLAEDGTNAKPQPRTRRQTKLTNGTNSGEEAPVKRRVRQKNVVGASADEKKGAEINGDSNAPTATRSRRGTGSTVRKRGRASEESKKHNGNEVPPPPAPNTKPSVNNTPSIEGDGLARTTALKIEEVDDETPCETPTQQTSYGQVCSAASRGYSLGSSLTSTSE
ncbi:unnamed protein product [Trypanosoma congolense IL3000]|uniref:WGS project CAEQ00000000 data, annotated contig 1769 n=1 Tax=Trypanosoma congolense (strain IL3000) TaxID=1068625 RepID=F9W8R7_TRYCI|nr:unnamed protein product [Trypanosoma congolense IL3000]